MEQPLRSDAFLKRAMTLCGDSVYRVALAQTGSPADAEDIYQDVFLRLLKDETAFTNDDHLKAWLLRVTINRCHDLQRSAWKRHTRPLEREHAAIAAPDAFRSDIWGVVGALPEDLRTVVHLFYVEGYPTDEIARIVQCPPATVRSRLFRAREQLRSTLGLPDRKDGATRNTFTKPPEIQDPARSTAFAFGAAPSDRAASLASSRKEADYEQRTNPSGPQPRPGFGPKSLTGRLPLYDERHEGPCPSV